MGVWDSKRLEDRLKKYLKLSIDEGFDEKQRNVFGVLANEAREHLEKLKAQWQENTKDRIGEDK